MFAQKGVELIQELERAKDFLPPFNVTQLLLSSENISFLFLTDFLAGRWSSPGTGGDESFV